MDVTLGNLGVKSSEDLSTTLSERVALAIREAFKSKRQKRMEAFLAMCERESDFVKEVGLTEDDLYNYVKETRRNENCH